MAVFTLPPELIAFYKQNLDYLSEHAVDPDKRRHSDPEEAPRHYIDMEYFHTFNKSASIDSIPFGWKEAVDKYSEDSLKAWGQLPWTIKSNYYALVKAFKEKDKQRILRISADIGHYVSDGHVPLHTTVNYNGQLTRQHGIHGLWETNIPETEGEAYDFIVGKAKYIEDPDAFLKAMITASHAQKDTVLQEEKELSERFDPDQKYTIGDKYKGVKRNYSEAYVKAYSKKLDNMVERKMRQSVLAVGSIWYTAWVNAGQPDLSRE